VSAAGASYGKGGNGQVGTGNPGLGGRVVIWW